MSTEDRESLLSFHLSSKFIHYKYTVIRSLIAFPRSSLYFMQYQLLFSLCSFLQWVQKYVVLNALLYGPFKPNSTVIGHKRRKAKKKMLEGEKPQKYEYKSVRVPEFNCFPPTVLFLFPCVGLLLCGRLYFQRKMEVFTPTSHLQMQH